MSRRSLWILCFALCAVLSACSGAASETDAEAGDGAATATAAPATEDTPAGTDAPTDASATGTSPDGELGADEIETVQVPTTPAGLSGLLQTVAVQRGHFEDAGVNVETVTIGEESDGPLLLSGAIDMATSGTLDVAFFRNQGQDIVILSPLFNQHARIMTPPDGPATLEALEGTSHGQIGLGSSTSRQLQVLLQATEGIDYVTYFDHLETDTATLPPMLDRGEVESIAIFPPLSVELAANGYQTVYGPLAEVWAEETGVPLMLSSVTMARAFVDENPESVRRVLNAFEAAIADINENPEEIIQEYGDVVGLNSEEGQQLFVENTATSPYYTFGLTDELIDSEMRFLEEAQSVGILEEVPEGIFHELEGAAQ